MTETIYDATPALIDPEGDLTPEWVKQDRKERAERASRGPDLIVRNFINYDPDYFKTHKLAPCSDDEL